VPCPPWDAPSRSGIKHWQTVITLAFSGRPGARLLKGQPAYLGYITFGLQVNCRPANGRPTLTQIGKKRSTPRVRDRIIKELAAVNPKLVPSGGGNKIGGVKTLPQLGA